MTVGKAGRIVWHDLFTSDCQQSMLFYGKVAGWMYQVEHATDFAWGGGERDFVLAVLNDEAGAGLVETPTGLDDGWVPYVEVRDVDVTADLAERLGGDVVRPPFEVPGVGRNALLRDPRGVSFGISMSRHGFPAPQRLFGPDVYLGDPTTFPREFYSQLFDWRAAPPGQDGDKGVLLGPACERVAISGSELPIPNTQPRWAPCLKVDRPDTALSAALAQNGELAGTLVSDSARGHRYLIRDPMATLFTVVTQTCSHSS